MISLDDPRPCPVCATPMSEVNDGFWRCPFCAHIEVDDEEGDQ